MSLFNKIWEFFFGSKKEAVVMRWKLKRPVPSNKPTVSSVINKSPIEYLLNDPTTPNLVKSVQIPSDPINSKFVIKSYKGGGYAKGTAEFQAANCHVTICNSINYYNTQTDKYIPRWPGTSILNVIPRAGTDLNAYYDRRSLKFFYMSNNKFGTVFTADSTDIVAHELGHSILDAYRPETWNAASLEVAAFHEAFGDITSILHAMLYDEVINHVLQQTGGNLRKPNIVSNLAEQFGSAIHAIDSTSGRNPMYLRSAINDFKYINPGSLPKNVNNDNELAAESHNFSRIFLGAFYEILVMIYEDILSTGVSALDAVKQARDIMAKYILKSIQNAPVNVKFYESMAKTLLWADVTLSNRKYHDRMHAIFMNRQILTHNLSALSLNVPKCNDESCVLKIQGNLRCKLANKFIMAQSDNPLYNVEINVPKQQIYLYDSEKNFYDAVIVDEDETLSGAHEMIIHLHETNSVSDDPKTPFEIKDGKLVRTCISCGGCCGL